MNIRLSLRIDKKLVEKARFYAAKKGKSISTLVADYFSLLQIEEEKKEEEKLPPGVASLKGILKDKKITEVDYKKYLEKKYL